MTLSVTIGAVNQTAFLQEGTATLKFNTLDLTLVDPATVPALGNTVTLTDPTWSGTVTRLQRRTGPRPGHKFVTVSATNEDVAGASAGPFGLSDAPSPPTTYGYDSLTVETSDNLDATSTTKGTCTIHRTGLWPAMTFALTCADLGYSATSFSVTDATVTWVKGVPRYHLSFGDPLVTMAAWTAAQAGQAPDGSISGTKITDLTITTPKLGANSVTAQKIAVGQLDPTMMSSSPVNLVPNPGGEAATVSGQTTLQGWVLTNTVIRLATLQRTGNAVFQAIAPSAAVYNAAVTGFLPVEGNRRYTGSVYVSGYGTNAATAQGTLQVSWYDSAQALISSAVFGASTKGTSTTFSLIQSVAVSPATAVWARILAIASTTVVTGDRLYFDDFAFYLSDFNLSHAGGNVVIDSDGVTITNGALTLTNAGSTVVIDGTSNMFKIAVSGTTTITGPAAGASTVSSLIDLGTLFAYAPTFLAWIEIAGTSFADTLPYVTINNATGHVSDCIAGFVQYNTPTAGHIYFRATWDSFVGGFSGVSKTVRYYVLKEIGF